MEGKEKKPSFDIEIKAEITGVAKIENNIAQVKEVALAMKDYYLTVEFSSDEDIKSAIEEKKKVNKFKDQVSDYRKNILAEYKKPIELFENTAKETEAILKEVYDTINKPVDEYREKEKQKISKKIKAYFEEYKISKNIDFVNFEDANINITLSTTEKKGREEAREFIDRISTDIEFIQTDDNNAEILVEYKQNGYNVSNAMITVRNRIKAIEEAKIKEENRKKIIESENVVINKVEKVLSKPAEKPTENIQEALYTSTFRVTATVEKLTELKTFLEVGGYDYE